MTDEERRIRSLRVGREVLVALLEVVDANLDASEKAEGSAPEEIRRGRSNCRMARPPSAKTCPRCGEGVYRMRYLGNKPDGRPENRRVCDSCGYLSGRDPVVRTMAYRVELLKEVGERLQKKYKRTE
jgi:ribosomal protein S27AE